MDIDLKGYKEKFRYRAAAIIIENNCLLMVKNKLAPYYYSVGGGVHINETSENAVKREVLEETGAAYEIDRLAFIQENFFTDNYVFKNLRCHEITMFFLMKPRGTQQLDSNSYSMGVREHMCWLPIDKLNEYQIYPEFFREKLKRLSDRIEHIVTVQN
ncbi:MAG TPA: NUDIX domain-containing protein [Clostridiales bacterium]|nr:NUDIX domain-containing protein [Clostridiales bacterium]